MIVAVPGAGCVIVGDRPFPLMTGMELDEEAIGLEQAEAVPDI